MARGLQGPGQLVGVIGPLTYTGWISICAMIALWLVMTGLGGRAKWLVGFALTVPFFVLLAYIDSSIEGPPILDDPYGPLIIILILGPIAFGWLLFGIAWLSRRFYKTVSEHKETSCPSS